MKNTDHALVDAAIVASIRAYNATAREILEFVGRELGWPIISTSKLGWPPPSFDAQKQRRQQERLVDRRLQALKRDGVIAFHHGLRKWEIKS
jgi:hypothetical protein